jgi:hypothetical protein
MFWQKSCPHCKGDLYQDSDVSGIYAKGLFRHSIETNIDRGKKESGLCTGSMPRPLQRLIVRISSQSATKKLTLEGG